MTVPAATASMPSHMTGATAGTARRLAGSETIETRSKWRASSGAVPRVAAVVSAAASASGAGVPRERSATASGEARTQDRDDRRERQLPAGIAGGPRIEPERDRGGEQQRVPARGRAAREDGDEAGGAHDPGPLDRGPGARQRDVQRDQDQAPDETRAQSGSERGQDRKPEGDEQHHVLTARGQQMGQPGDAEVLARGLVERLVLAENHSPRQGGARRVEAAADRALGRPAHRIERSRNAAAPAPRDPHALGEEPPVRPAPAQPAVALAQRQQAAPGHDLLPHVHARPAGRAHDDALPHPAAAREPDESGSCRAATDGARPLEHVAARRGLCPDQRTQRGPVERREPNLGEPGAGEHGARGEQREAGTRDGAGDRRAGEEPRQPGGGERAGGHGRGEHPRDERGEDEVTGVRAKGLERPDHTVTRSFRAAIRAGPIPGTRSSSATERKPPCSWR